MHLLICGAGQQVNKLFSVNFPGGAGSIDILGKMFLSVPFSSAGCRTGNGDQLSSSQAEPGQAISTQMLLTIPPFPVRHPALGHGT